MLDVQNAIKNYIPMSETAFYILLSLTEPKHGYAIMQHVEELTSKRVTLGAGTLYGSISKMERDGLIEFISEGNKRKTYQITETGYTVLKSEAVRLRELYLNAKGVLEQ